MRTFCIADVHGHNDRLVELLLKANIEPNHPAVEIVQLGDLIHAGIDTREGDEICLELAKIYNMTLLWGNHDLACVDPGAHSFRGYCPPTTRSMSLLTRQHYFALERHGYLLTHAGLHPWYNPLKVEAGETSRLINDSFGFPITQDIGPARGGPDFRGGVVWRDDSEDLCDIPQVYGHTRGDIRNHGSNRYCLDTGSKTNGSLVGLWLPDLKLVAVGPDAHYHETTPVIGD